MALRALNAANGCVDCGESHRELGFSVRLRMSDESGKPLPGAVVRLHGLNDSAAPENGGEALIPPASADQGAEQVVSAIAPACSSAAVPHRTAVNGARRPDRRDHAEHDGRPSFLNWPALPVALADTNVPDFPLANKSFNLSHAGNDL